MKKLAVFGLLALLANLPLRAPAQPVLVAASRCNGRMVSDYASQIRKFDQRPPRNVPSELQTRYQEIDAVLQTLSQEREILESICSDNEKQQYATQIAAAAAWGLALQSDIAVKLQAPCPPASKAIAQALLAQGWLDLANVVNMAPPTASPPPTTQIAEVVPKVQTRAQALGLTLPAYGSTSAYWATTLSDAAKAAVAACTPVTSPSPGTQP